MRAFLVQSVVMETRLGEREGEEEGREGGCAGNSTLLSADSRHPAAACGLLGSHASLGWWDINSFRAPRRRMPDDGKPGSMEGGREVDRADGKGGFH